MAEPTKDELEKGAEAVGIDPSGMTKPEIKDAIDARSPRELGPVVGSDGFPQHGSITGVAPLTADDIPDAGR